MRRYLTLILLPLLLWLMVPSCMEWDYGSESEEFNAPDGALYICNEGNFQYGNATLSVYDPTSRQVENEVFFRANGYRLGDVAQSMTMFGGRGWIVVNNSHIIWAINPHNFRETGRIENLNSPRFILPVEADKAYVTQLWDNRICIVNPLTYEITGYIPVPEMAAGTGSTEQMVRVGQYVYCTCWSYQSRVIKIDTETDRVVGQVEVGLQPRSIVADRNGSIWTLTDGGYEGSPQGYEEPALVRINGESMTVDARYQMPLGSAPSALTVSADGSVLYWIEEDVWSMKIDSASLPSRPLIPSRGTRYYALTVSPADGNIYVSDALDYQQQGVVRRFSPEGVPVDEFYVGVTPGNFCW